MRKLLLMTGDIAAGKSTFSGILSQRYGVAVFQKDTIKEILGDSIGFHNREENKRLSKCTMDIMFHIFSRLAQTGSSLILEANFHQTELEKLHRLAEENTYKVLTLVLQGDKEALYQRYLYRMKEENRHPVHLSTTLDVREDFFKTAEWIRSIKVPGEKLQIDATDFSYQKDLRILGQIDAFMKEVLSE